MFNSIVLNLHRLTQINKLYHVKASSKTDPQDYEKIDFELSPNYKNITYIFPDGVLDEKSMKIEIERIQILKFTEEYKNKIFEGIESLKNLVDKKSLNVKEIIGSLENNVAKYVIFFDLVDNKKKLFNLEKNQKFNMNSDVNMAKFKENFSKRLITNLISSVKKEFEKSDHDESIKKGIEGSSYTVKNNKLSLGECASELFYPYTGLRIIVHTNEKKYVSKNWYIKNLFGKFVVSENGQIPEFSDFFNSYQGVDKADTNEGQAGETPQEVFGRPKKPAILRNIPSSKKPKSTSTQKSSTEGLNISWKLIALIVVLLAILGIGVFLFFNSRGNSTNSEEKI